MATPVEELDLPNLDSDGASDPEREVASLARQSEQGWLAKFAFGYVVLHYDDVTALLRDRHLHQASQLVATLFTGEGTALDELDREGILSAEGDRHTRLRRLVSAPFAPRSIDRLRPFMREYVEELAGPPSSGARESVVDAAALLSRYPIAVICHHLDVERADWELFSQWAETTFLIFSSEVKGNEERVVRESRAFSAYCTALVDERRRHLGDDLISPLIEAEQEGDRLDTRDGEPHSRDHRGGHRHDAQPALDLRWPCSPPGPNSGTRWGATRDSSRAWSRSRCATSTPFASSFDRSPSPSSTATSPSRPGRCSPSASPEPTATRTTSPSADVLRPQSPRCPRAPHLLFGDPLLPGRGARARGALRGARGTAGPLGAHRVQPARSTWKDQRSRSGVRSRCRCASPTPERGTGERAAGPRSGASPRRRSRSGLIQQHDRNRVTHLVGDE